jgi:6-pyruvoyltetrahydropterin/6-carboxytetrahydropterin synthase
MKNRLTKIELFKENMTFSAGHFTIFSATERENLHGHNFLVHVNFETEVIENGMAFNYDIYKKVVLELCQFLNEVVLLPGESPYLNLEESPEYIYALFNYDQEKIPFLKRDVKLLPLRNISVEEMADWFLQKILVYVEENPQHLIHGIEVKIFSEPGQSASSFWSKK